MAITIPESAPSDFPELAIGTYQAVISGIWDIGIQKSEFNGEVKFNQQVIIRYELNKAIPSGQYAGDRYTLNQWVNLPKSFDDRSKFIQIRNAAESRNTVATDYINYDEQQLVGKNVFLAVKHSKKGKAVVDGVSAMMEGMPPIAPMLKPEMPDWVKKQAENAVGGQTQSTAQPTQPIPPVEAYNNMPPASEDDLPY